MTTTLSRAQARIFGALLILAAVYFLKGWLFQWLFEQGLFAVHVPPDTDYSSALRMNRAVVNGLFCYEMSNLLLCVGLINSLEQAVGFLPRLVNILAHLLAALYTVALVLSFLPALVPCLILLG
jgi:hypothetical protein